jgi:hypothetical protein
VPFACRLTLPRLSTRDDITDGDDYRLVSHGRRNFPFFAYHYFAFHSGISSSTSRGMPAFASSLYFHEMAFLAFRHDVAAPMTLIASFAGAYLMLIDFASIMRCRQHTPPHQSIFFTGLFLFAHYYRPMH